MNVSYKWLQDYVDLNGYNGAQLAALMTSGGIEIDIVEQRNKGVTGVVVGHVVEREKHPDADKLSVCKVDVGGEQQLQIVCGAPNVAAGQLVPVAVVGAVMPGNFKIKRAKLRGVESQGMICSAKELGINDKLLPKEQQEGILVLPVGTPIGASILDILALEDEVLELDLTPNRSDCLSMLGAAYEVAALTGRPVQLPDTTIADNGEQAADELQVSIASEAPCTHYAARLIKGVSIAPSPLWVQNRLIAAGVRPINNVVDVTNYVMLEYGQPLHAFDANKVNTGRIHVRLATEGESLTTLDGQQRTLASHMLVITDGERPVALAGVMGGADTEVSAETTTILLESARFDGSSVRKTSRQLGLRSESSARFEKGVDAARVRAALDRAALLIQQLAGGEVLAGVVEAVTPVATTTAVTVAYHKINAYLGTALTQSDVEQIFTRLQFAFEYDVVSDTFVVQVPTRRGDITRDVDLIEEVARLYGYDNIPTTPIEGPATPGALTKPQAIRRELRKVLTNVGLHEVISYSLTHPARTALFPSLTNNSVPIALSLPMSEDRSRLRTALLPQLMEIATYNRNRKNDDVAIFEIGNVFHTEQTELTQLPTEKHRLAVLLTGNRVRAGWNRKAEAVDFYDAKGVIEKIAQVFGLTELLTYEAAELEHMHPGRTAVVRLNGDVIGFVGQLHPTLQKENDLADTFVIELELAAIYEAANAAIVYRTLPKYPAVQRDIALVVAATVEVGQLISTVKANANELLESVHVFDIYTGERLGADKKSVALALVYRHAEHTLTDEEVTAAHQHIVEKLTEKFDAELRN